VRREGPIVGWNLTGIVASPGDDFGAVELAKASNFLPGSLTFDAGIELSDVFVVEKGEHAGSVAVSLSITDRDLTRAIEKDEATAERVLAGIGAQAVPPMVEFVRKSDPPPAAEQEAPVVQSVPSDPKEILALATSGAASFGFGVMSQLEKIADALSIQRPIHVHAPTPVVNVDVAAPDTPEIHNHVNVEAQRKPTRMEAYTKDGVRHYKPVYEDEA
jgi:hypothetical protein